MKILEIEPIESLILSKSPIASPDTFGAHEVLPAPLPSTVAGLLGRILNIYLEPDDARSYGFALLLETLRKQGCREPVLRGPLMLVEIRNSGISEPHITIEDFLVPISAIERKGDRYEIDTSKCRIKISREDRIGVTLIRGYEGESKVAKQGFTYSYRTVRYESLDGETVPVRIIYIAECKIEEKLDLARIGGESRRAVVRLRNPDEKIKAYIEKLKSPKEVDEGIYIALSPIPIIPRENQLWLDEDTQGTEFIDKIIGIPQKRRKEEPGRSPKRKVERLSLGYSEVLNIRRPQILCLPPGTIVKTRRVEKAHQLVEILWSLGYASLYKLG